MVTLDAAAGPLTKARDKLRAALAASSTFQTWVGAESSAEALERIHLSAVDLPHAAKAEYTEDELADVLPCAILHTVRYVATHDASGVRWEYRDSGILNLHLIGYADSGTASYPAACGRKFENVIDGILDDLKDVAGTSSGLAFTLAEMPEEPQRGKCQDLPTAGDLFRVDLLFHW